MACCDFQEILFPARSSSLWRLVLHGTVGKRSLTMQYLQFQVIGRVPEHAPRESDPFLLVGEGVCGTADGRTLVNHALDRDGNCQARCAADPSCPGFAGPDIEKMCIW